MLQGSTSVAVKFVRGHSPKEQARFRNEVGILKSLRHTNIVQARAAPLCLHAHCLSCMPSTCLACKVMHCHIVLLGTKWVLGKAILAAVEACQG